MVSSIIKTLKKWESDHPIDAFDSVREYQKDPSNALKPNDHGLLFRLADSLSRMWDMGMTAFGGPPVHFQIIHRRFVEGQGGKVPWMDEQTYQELFAVCQALPGPGSTKMLFCTVLFHAGLIPAIVAFLIWSLPGALGMYGLAVGVSQIGETLPGPVYSLLSGLNAATVGIIALAAVSLAQKAITDPLTRILVVAGACAGVCYSSLWYFPVIMLIGGLVTVLWDLWLSRAVGRFRAKMNRQRLDPQSESGDGADAGESVPVDGPASQPEGIQRRNVGAPQPEGDLATKSSTAASSPTPEEALPTNANKHNISGRQGIYIIISFFITFAAVMIARSIITSPPLILRLFSNMYLAGTIIFGGGPVVIPLLREYVVEPGWVSPRDFLIGLAIIQAFPGPNFNFAVYLSALAIRPTTFPTILGAILGFVGIYTPGVVLALGIQGLWRVLRTMPLVISILRGVNATAVGLIFTAVYRLWERGYLTPSESDGMSLADQPWWVVVAVTSYTISAWFATPPAVAIAIGGIMGLCWYAAVGWVILGI